MTVFSRPGSAGALMSYESRYQNFIGGQWVAPVHGRYFENPTPVTGQPFCEVPRSDAADIDKALDAAHAAAPGWGKTAPAERAAILNMIADRIDKNAAALAVAEVWDNGKPVREALAADIPLAVDLVVSKVCSIRCGGACLHRRRSLILMSGLNAMLRGPRGCRRRSSIGSARRLGPKTGPLRRSWWRWGSCSPIGGRVAGAARSG